MAPTQRLPSRSSKRQRTRSWSRPSHCRPRRHEPVAFQAREPPLVPAQMLPSRSSHKARTKRSGSPSRGRTCGYWPPAERSINPRLPPNQRLSWRSASRADDHGASELGFVDEAGELAARHLHHAAEAGHRTVVMPVLADLAPRRRKSRAPARSRELAVLRSGSSKRRPRSKAFPRGLHRGR